MYQPLIDDPADRLILKVGDIVCGPRWDGAFEDVTDDSLSRVPFYQGDHAIVISKYSAGLTLKNLQDHFGINGIGAFRQCANVVDVPAPPAAIPEEAMLVEYPGWYRVGVKRGQNWGDQLMEAGDVVAPKGVNPEGAGCGGRLVLGQPMKIDGYAGDPFSKLIDSYPQELVLWRANVQANNAVDAAPAPEDYAWERVIQTDPNLTEADLIMREGDIVGLEGTAWQHIRSFHNLPQHGCAIVRRDGWDGERLIVAMRDNPRLDRPLHLMRKVPVGPLWVQVGEGEDATKIISQRGDLALVPGAVAEDGVYSSAFNGKGISIGGYAGTTLSAIRLAEHQPTLRLFRRTRPLDKVIKAAKPLPLKGIPFKRKSPYLKGCPYWAAPLTLPSLTFAAFLASSLTLLLT